MSRGRKPKKIFAGSDWERIYKQSQGFYFEYIVIQLGRKNKKLTNDNANDLLKIIREEKDELLAEKKIKKQLPYPKIEDEEIPFDIPENWTWCRLGEIAEVVRGGSPRPAGDKRFYDGEIPFLKVADLTATEDIFVESHTYSIKEAGLHKTRMVEPNTLMLTNSGATLGIPKICTFETTFNDGIAAFLYIDNINKLFLYYFLKSKSKWYLNEASRGQGQPNLNTKIIGNTFLSLPPIGEQEMITNFLQDFGNESLDKDKEYFDSEIESEVISYQQAQLYNTQTISEIKKQLELVSQLRQAFLREAMQGKLVPQDTQDEPAEVLIEKIKAEKEKLIAEKKIKKQKPLLEIIPEEIPFEIPNNWTWCRLGEIAELKSGNQYKYKKLGNGVMYVKVGDMNLSGNEYEILDSSIYFDKNDIKLKDLIPIKSIIFPKRGGAIATNKRRAILKEAILVDSNTMAVTPSSKMNFDFFLWWFNTIDLAEFGNANIIPQVNNKDIIPLMIPLPPLAEQKRIVEKLKKLMAFCDELEANIQESKTNAENLLQVALKEALEPKQYYKHIGENHEKSDTNVRRISVK